ACFRALLGILQRPALQPGYARIGRRGLGTALAIMVSVAVVIPVAILISVAAATAPPAPAAAIATFAGPGFPAGLFGADLARLLFALIVSRLDLRLGGRRLLNLGLGGGGGLDHRGRRCLARSQRLDPLDAEIRRHQGVVGGEIDAQGLARLELGQRLALVV